ncbi:DNA-directed RNA polymerase [Puccinia graminis f. sp. tritici]|uniref:DNA-directed RNA polymerase n=1 Tax=Puccinia graminis f. sp. tritici TaxID=56615 RepID=A0A5B0LYN1_PUCGR|nr:DNA-directed RNA polymerase [Puccinia graminis f. sp. tritici]KAA1104233.1 DNA-directed RNA polymerase [Puccinia graminis f. sp. tritici]
MMMITNRTKKKLLTTRTRILSYQTTTRRRLTTTQQEQEQEQEPALFESAFHQGNLPSYLRPPLPPTTSTTTGRQSKNHQPKIDYSQFNNGFNSSRSQDQLSQLTVSIAIGDLQRAQSIILEIERSLGYLRTKAFFQTNNTLNELLKLNKHFNEPLVQRDPNDHHLPTLNQIIHPSIFSSLLRRTLVQAIKQESLGNLNHAHILQSHLFHWLLNFKLNGPHWAQVDHHLMAGVLKGVLFLKDPIYSVLDYMPWILPSSADQTKKYQPPSTTSLPPTLLNVLDSITFMISQTKSFFGSLDKHQALERIKEQAMKEGRQDVLDEVEVVERHWNAGPSTSPNPASLDNPSGVNSDLPIPLHPVRKPSKSTDDPSKEREIPMRLSHLLSNVSTIPESATQSFTTGYDRQMVLEYAGYDSAEAEWFEGHKEIKERGIGFTNGEGGQVLQAWMWEWWAALKEWFDELEVDDQSGNILDAKKETVATDLRFIKVLQNSLIAKVAVVEVIREMGNSTINDGAKSIGLFIALGKAIENEWYAQTIKAIPELNQKLLAAIKTLNQENLDATASRSVDHTVRKIWKSELKNYQADLQAIHGDNFDWTIQQRSKVGALVMRGLLETSKITRSTVLEDGSVYEEVQPAFYQTTQYFDGKRVGVTKMNEAVAERLDLDPANVSLHPRYLPMVCRPMPWTHPKNGAYLVHGAPLMRTRDSPEQALHLLEAHRFHGLENVYKALDKLGNTPWNINRPVFDTMSTVWNQGIQLAGIPIRDPHLNLKPDQIEKLFFSSPPPSSTTPASDDEHLDQLENQSSSSSSQLENPRSEGEKKEIYRSLLASRRSAYGQRCSVNYQLEIARAYLNETFYFPHNIDFRGRAYPIPANLNHIGDDISRGLLKFAEEKELGADGLRWLKIHLSNKYGNDKASLDDRAKFIEERLELVFDSADRPLEGKRWWLESEDPWQTLAGCMELTAALRSPDPRAYRSSLPVHQDGSCNGLQHYAALGGDIDGGKEVNLVPGEKPGDVYSKVAVEVAKLVDFDAANGHDIAKALKGHIKRKVVKQTVMTTVYGVTFVGAREQIKRQLKDLGVIPIPNLYISAAYVATLVLRSIGEVFKGAVAIQKWLTIVARLVSKSIPPERVESLSTSPSTAKKQKEGEGAEGVAKTKKPRPVKRKLPGSSSAAHDPDVEVELMTSMTWTTPLGLVVCQPYRAQNRTQIKTVLQTVYIADPFEPAQADSRSQASAFPPNFIHSLDATHMMLTALACQDITFASVHDSYWTHASSVDHMNSKLRESFVRLHTTRILDNLVQEIKHRYEGYMVPKNALTSRMINELKAMGIDRFNSPSSSSTTTSTTASSSTSSASTSTSDTDTQTETDSNSNKGTITGNSSGKFLELNQLIPPLPPRGNLNIQDVIKSKYFFA